MSEEDRRSSTSLKLLQLCVSLDGFPVFVSTQVLLFVVLALLRSLRSFDNSNPAIIFLVIQLKYSVRKHRARDRTTRLRT
jgi:hypothetical protein